MEPLKNVYHKSFFTPLTIALEELVPSFDSKAFLKAVFNKEWESKELKARMKHIVAVLHAFLGDDYPKNIKTLLKVIDRLRKNGVADNGFAYLFFPEYIEGYGINHLETSIDALEKMNTFISCEFAVRPFIKKYPDQMMKQMLLWSTHKHVNLRRFASEGCRPRLPWAMALPDLKKDPSPIFPILENLKTDESEYVRRSVANNLNDIVKDHPELVLKLAKRWQGKHDYSDWIIKHGTRTLLKKGHTEALSLFGFAKNINCIVDHLTLSHHQLKIGEAFTFSFRLKNQHKKDTKLRIEYLVYFMKSNGKQATKIFKITENLFVPGEHAFQKKHSFKDLTTRKHYKGAHKLAIVINGQEMATKTFMLL